jgi:hypothetical protein
MNPIINKLTKATCLRIRAALRFSAAGVAPQTAASCLHTTGNTARSDI